MSTLEKDTEFYIGWQAEAPPRIARSVRRAVLIIVIGSVGVALLTVLAQRGFNTATFEFGQTTELEGWVTAEPFPMLNLPGTASRPKQQLLLLSPGKFGAAQKLHEIAQKIGQSIVGQRVHMRGFLIYHDGKTAFEISDATLLPVNGAKTPSIPVETIADSVCLRGEITDPKCLLGVMKPSQGKSHLDCAVRCIAGGIPPVLKVANAAGVAEYYLLIGPDGQAINQQLLPFVGYGVSMQGRLERQGDWLYLRTNPLTIKHFDKSMLHITMCH